MLKFEHTKTHNLDGAIRGMRNPFDSWHLSDSRWEFVPTSDNQYNTEFKLGTADLDLAQRLIRAGSDHRKFMRQIIVCVDITAPFYWWKQFDTYKVGTVANSCSTMHTLSRHDLTLDSFSHDKLGQTAVEFLKKIIRQINLYRANFQRTKDKYYWWQMEQLLPDSYNQKRTITLSYETIYRIHKSRKDHKLDEWTVDFMEWIDTLPYAEELLKI